MSNTSKTLVEWLDERCPPFLAVALARTGRNGDWIRLAEIAKTAGISERTAWRIFSEPSWAKNMKHASAFLAACRIDPFHMHRQRQYMVETLGSERPYNHIPTRLRKKFMRRMAELSRRLR